MTSLLYIKANPKKTKDSWSYKMSDFFINKYKELNPQDLIIELNLYDDPPNYLYQNIAPEERKVDFTQLKHTPKYVNQFIEADKYVIATPVWNFSIPAILKGYMDQIAVFGKTYTYIEGKGAAPLLKDKNKKMLTLIAMGGKIERGSGDFAGPLLKYFFGTFLGISSYTDITIEGTSKYTLQELEKTLQEKQKMLIDFLKTF